VEGLRSWFCLNQLEPYREIFAPGKSESGFENTKRRFAWFKRTLKEAGENKGILEIFPETWQMTQLFASEFCRMTREHLDEIMQSSHSQIDIALIIQAMQQSIEFERDLHSRFDGSKKPTTGGVSFDNSNNVVVQGSGSLEDLKNKYSQPQQMPA